MAPTDMKECDKSPHCSFLFISKATESSDITMSLTFAMTTKGGMILERNDSLRREGECAGDKPHYLLP